MWQIYNLSSKDANRITIQISSDSPPRTRVDKVLKEINSHFDKDEEKAQLNYARNLYLDCLNGKSQIKNIGSIIVNTSTNYENLTLKQQNEVDLFFHNNLFQSDYKLENLIDSKGKPKDTIYDNFTRINPYLYSNISSEVNRYINDNSKTIQNASYIEAKKLNSGGFGNIYLYDSFDTNQKFIRKKPKHHDIASCYFINESNLTDDLGRIGAISRGIRRNRKGYDLNIRLSTPQVYSKGHNIDMEFFEKGDFTRPHDTIDIYDFLKQTTKLQNDLHTNGYVHRDIKPDNLLLGNDDKIRLADMDSVIKKEMYRPNRNFGTKYYTNTNWYSDPDKYIDKIDIYATAVSVINYIIGDKNFNLLLDKIEDTYFSKQTLQLLVDDVSIKKHNMEINNLVKTDFEKIVGKFQDKHLGMIISDMLNNHYTSAKEILVALEENPTAKDKKDLKIALSFLKSGDQTDEILKYLSKRRNICKELASNNNFLFFISKSILEQKLNKCNNAIAQKLTQNLDNLSEAQIKHLQFVAKKFELNIFTTNNFVITNKSIENQKSKNISIEKLHRAKIRKLSDLSRLSESLGFQQILQ